jgi:hypothetical protein
MDSRFRGNDELVVGSGTSFTFETGHMVYTKDSTIIKGAAPQFIRNTAK